MKNLQFTFNGVTKLVKFTEPQASIMEALERGEEIIFQGETMVWKRTKETVGWRAFNGAMFAIRKAFNLNTEEEKVLYHQYI